MRNGKGGTYELKKKKKCERNRKERQHGIYARLQKLGQMHISINIHNKDKWNNLTVSKKTKMRIIELFFINSCILVIK